VSRTSEIVRLLKALAVDAFTPLPSGMKQALFWRRLSPLNAWMRPLNCRRVTTPPESMLGGLLRERVEVGRRPWSHDPALTMASALS
jgi:hypothetical protein